VSEPGDPLVRTWARVFPGIFVPLDRMPPDLRAHIRYPEDLYRVQTTLYGTYHMEAPEDFYHREDQWQIPTVARQEGATPFMRHMVMRLPDEREAEFVYMVPFTPRGKDNLAAWMVARNDGAVYGKLRVYRLPRQRLVFGPQQVQNRINQNTEIARQVMEKRDFSLRVRKTTQDEIGYLVDAINDLLAEVGRRQEALEASNLTLGREMAERARVEDQLRELNIELERRVDARTAQLEAANKELESFSYSVSHDLRAPVRAIIGFSRMLSEDHIEQFDAEAQRLLGVVQSEAHRMGTLIDDLLAFSRMGRQAIQTVDIDMTQSARSTYEGLIAQQATNNVDFQLGALPRARGDRSLLGQVWVNLIANALKFSGKQAKPRIEVSAISDETEHVYFVRDNGVGFDPRYQSKLYGVFQRLHDAADFPGTGVGLALVQRIVTRHGGRVWADSKPNEGATFYFTLPREHADGTDGTG